LLMMQKAINILSGEKDEEVKPLKGTAKS